MASSTITFSSTLCVVIITAFAAITTNASSEVLSPYYYDQVCPQALAAIKRVVEKAINNERRMGASLLRLHFHDCFVNGCDASILLDSSSTTESEKNAAPNANSARGFEVIDQIKSQVDKICGRPVVSCADILAVAARDSVVALGGPTWRVRLGRRDSTTANRTAADNDIPSPFMDLPALINNFNNQGLNQKDLVALAGAHTIGFAQCRLFRNRIYNETNIDPEFAQQLQSNCPAPQGQGDSNLASLDPTPTYFDLGYYYNLMDRKGLLHSDQALYNGGSTDDLVRGYSYNGFAFFRDFARSMIKMGNIKPLTGDEGQIRTNCRVVN